jgi:outer membrane protein TolC
MWLRKYSSSIWLLSLSVMFPLFALRGYGQISLISSVNLALSDDPRVRMAESDVARAQANLQEARDAFVPSITGASSGAGYSYGFPLGIPTVFSVSAQSLVFSFSQKDYIRAAREGLASSDRALKEIRDNVTEDATVTYIALSNDQQQHAALLQEAVYAARLQQIVKDRFEAGRETEMNYLRAKRNVVQIHLQVLQMEDAMANDGDHLGRLINIPGNKVTTDPASIPSLPVERDSSEPSDTPPLIEEAIPDSPGVAASFANAKSKREQAFGDSRYVLRPQFSFAAEYGRFSTYNNTYATYYPSVTAHGLSENAVGFGLNITVPLFDASHRARARVGAAEAVHAEQQALMDRRQYREELLKLSHSLAELQTRAQLASIDRDIAQQQLNAVLLQLNASGSTRPNTPAMTPEDEQNARILERQRYVDMLEAEFQLRQAGIHFLKQTQQLSQWLSHDLVPATTSSPGPDSNGTPSREPNR